MANLFGEISDWSTITLKHLLYAYRKAKADCYFDRTISVAESFAAYEQQLTANLERLLQVLNAGLVAEILRADESQVRLVAKKLSVEPKNEDPAGEPRSTNDAGHTFFSDSRRAFDRLLASASITPEFRAIGDFDVDVHVVGALWILTIGNKLDRCLSDRAYGARLRRLRPDSPNGAKERGAIHVEALGSFEPYFGPYRRWREGGLDAIRQELKSDRQVIAMSLDLANYYHQVDPSFLLSSEFFNSIGVQLSSWEAGFNREFVEFLLQWSTVASQSLQRFGASIVGAQAGIPIGIAATRIISNVLLAELDREVERGLAPIYYGRYVDDIFLVLRDPGHLLSASDAMRYIAERVRIFPPTAQDGPIQLKLPRSYGSCITAEQAEGILSKRSGWPRSFR